MPGEPRGCEVEGCEGPHLARGMCRPHYAAWRHRTPAEQRPRKTEAERFWEKVDLGDGTGCWLWTGARNPNGYGQFWSGRRLGLAHRYAYETLVGPIPDGLSLDHLCRVPACVNPVHLEPVSHRENCLRGISPAAQQAQQTHCKNGREFTEENTRLQILRSGRVKRHCRECAKAYRRAHPEHHRHGRR